MKLLVACPVRDRAWILPLWHSHLLDALPSGVELECLFLAGTDDAETLAVVREIGDVIEVEESGPGVSFLGVEFGAKNRQWDIPKFDHMVTIRNRLMEEAVKRSPDRYLSLDSDILLHPEALTNLIESSSSYDLVGGKAYMGPGVASPSAANMRYLSGMTRITSAGPCRVDVIMAIKLMNPAAFGKASYVTHRQGEDIGFCLDAKRKGLTIGYDGRVCSKHIMTREALHQYDKRCGF